MELIAVSYLGSVALLFGNALMVVADRLRAK